MFRSREVQPKAAAGDSVGLDTDGSAHFFGGLSDDGEADAGTLIALLLVDALEHAKEAVLVFGLDADAIILDPQATRAVVCLGPNVEAGQGAAGDELDAVGEKVGEDLG